MSDLRQTVLDFLDVSFLPGCFFKSLTGFSVLVSIFILKEICSEPDYLVMPCMNEERVSFRFALLRRKRNKAYGEIRLRN
jgi:hypothetical protein